MLNLVEVRWFSLHIREGGDIRNGKLCLNGGYACATVCVWWPRERQRAGGKDEEMLEGEEESPERREEAGGR